MIDLKLGNDEGIMLESECATWIANEEINLSSLILTNKNIYCVYKKSNGLFAKSTTECITKPLSEIKIINGQPLVERVKGDDGPTLQIQFMDSRDRFYFDEKAGRTTDQWVNEIYKIITGSVAPTRQNEAISNAKGAFSGITAGLKKAADSAIQNASDSVKQYTESGIAEKNKESIAGAVGALSGFATNVKSAANDAVKSAVSQYSDYQEKKTTADLEFKQMLSGSSENGNPAERQQEFAGIILKCPNCGAPIGQTTAICPDCGHRITGQAAVSSVQRFSNQLMLLESNRKRDGLGHVFGTSVNPTDKQKLALIQSFAIPNTIDDIQEFILLAIANIDVSQSKASIGNKWNNMLKTSETSLTIDKTISDAWVSKMQQAYHKAKISFSEGLAFLNIKQIYTEKMKELKMPIE